MSEPTHCDPTDDPFARLGMPRAYEIDAAAVERSHLKRSAAMHPDRIADPVRREEAGRELAALNEARDILLDDERRADALLLLLGGPAREEDRALPDGFLMEIMELREKLDALAPDDAAGREAVEAEAAQRREAHRATAARLFAAASAGDRGALPSIRRELNAWRYIERLRDALDM